MVYTQDNKHQQHRTPGYQFTGFEAMTSAILLAISLSHASRGLFLDHDTFCDNFLNILNTYLKRCL